MNEWWENRYSESYWLEITGRTDLGANLKAPQTNEKGKAFWSYSLLEFVQAGDIIFHYYRPKQAIVARSVATGDKWEDKIVWAARGSSARDAGIKPHIRDGWYAGLEKYAVLEAPIHLDEIRIFQSQIKEKKTQLEIQVGSPLYFPFELGKKRPLRPMQGYLFKLPSFFVELFLPSKDKSVFLELNEDKYQPFGTEYRIADETTAVGQRDPFLVDPVIVERGLRSHAKTQNALAHFLKNHGIEPRSPSPNEPNFDLGWIKDSVTWIAEIKSLTNENEEKQLRLGLGQVLRYRHILSSKSEVKAALVVERKPNDTSWLHLCKMLDITLTWPEQWQQSFSV